MAFLPARYRQYGGDKIKLDDLKQIENRYIDAGFSIPKYLQLCRRALETNRYAVNLYDSRSTVSKYVTVRYGKKKFKIRFSNHPPNKEKEQNGESDFFVGVTNFTITNTNDAWKALNEYFCK